jgi:hypothetical protein
MTVKELIEQLQKLPQDAKVGTSMSELTGWVGVACGIGTAMTTDGLVVTIDQQSENFCNPVNPDDETDIEIVYRSNA